MVRNGRIITIGLSPAWDVSCRGRHLDWGLHAEIDEQVVRPAGKAMNVAYALAWLGRRSVAAGLWGREDYAEMKTTLRRLGGRIQTRMTTSPGSTRRNITVVDTLRHREMHLRLRSELASPRTLQRLTTDLRKLVHQADTCVFAGAMPADLADTAAQLVRACHHGGASVVVDTYGPALANIVDTGLASMISPNVAELCELLCREVDNTPARLATASRPLLEKTGTVLVSRGEEGALAVTKHGAWTGRSKARRPALSTVGCGDYLLAGFLTGWRNTADPCAALVTGLRVAAARAWGWTDTRTWSQADSEIEVIVKPL